MSNYNTVIERDSLQSDSSVKNLEKEVRLSYQPDQPQSTDCGNFQLYVFLPILMSRRVARKQFE